MLSTSLTTFKLLCAQQCLLLMNPLLQLLVLNKIRTVFVVMKHLKQIRQRVIFQKVNPGSSEVSNLFIVIDKLRRTDSPHIRGVSVVWIVWQLILLTWNHGLLSGTVIITACRTETCVMSQKPHVDMQTVIQACGRAVGELCGISGEDLSP